MSTLHDCHMQAMAQIDMLFFQADRRADLDQAAAEFDSQTSDVKSQDADDDQSD